MKQLILVRHAKSSWENPGLRDFDRPLNSRGLKDGPRMAKWLKRKIHTADAIVSSTAKRALTTAEYFASKLFDDPGRIIHQEDLYHASSEGILEVIRELDDEYNKVLIFGHNPGFTYFADQFSEKMIHNIPTCGIVNVDFEIGSWKNADWDNGMVVFFMFPKMLNNS